MSDKSSGYAVGVEGGQRFRLGDAWSLTPEAQVSYGRAAFNAFSDVYGASVSVQQGRDLVGRIDKAVDYRSTWQGARGPIDSHLYAITNPYRGFEGAAGVDVYVADLISSNERLWAGLGIGGSLGWIRFSIYGEVQGRTGVSHFGDSHEVTGTLVFACIGNEAFWRDEHAALNVFPSSSACQDGMCPRTDAGSKRSIPPRDDASGSVACWRIFF